MFGPVMGVQVVRSSVGVMGSGTEEVKVDAMHGFRPK